MNNDNTSQDIRKLSRTVLRQNDVDIIMNGEDGSFVAKDVKITPKFASIVEKIAKEKKERLEQMLHDFSDATEIWVPPVEEVPSVEEKKIVDKKNNKKEKPKKVDNKKTDKKIEDKKVVDKKKAENKKVKDKKAVDKKKAENKKDNKKEKPKKEKPNKKERIILEIDFIPDKKFDAELNDLNIIFESDIELD